MTKRFLLSVIYLLSIGSAHATSDLLQVFQLSLANDPVYQQAVTQVLATNENIAISRANLLPDLSLKIKPQQDKLHSTGSQVRSGIMPPANDLRGLDMKLTATQTIFNFAQFVQLKEAQISARQINASLNAAAQDLMLRVTQAYFNVVIDQENLIYYKKNKELLARELQETIKLKNAGSNTSIDVATAKSAYGSAEINYIDAETRLSTDKEFLQTITGTEITNLAKLNNDFRLTSPQPENIEAWVHKAELQNWTVQANRYATEMAKQVIVEKFSGNLPTVDMELSYDVQGSNSTASSILYSAGASKTRDAGVLLNLNIPIFSGGSVVSQTRQAKYNYQIAQQQLEAALRNTTYTTQQSYLNVLSSIRKINNDKFTINAAQASLEGLQKQYNEGEETLVNVLSQQNNVIQSQMQYTSDRKTYIINLLTLKKSAGTLSVEDLEIVNRWLS